MRKRTDLTTTITNVNPEHSRGDEMGRLVGKCITYLWNVCILLAFKCFLKEYVPKMDDR